MKCLNKIQTIIISTFIMLCGLCSNAGAETTAFPCLKWRLPINEVKTLEKHELVSANPLWLSYKYPADYHAEALYVVYDFDAEGLCAVSETRMYANPVWETFFADCRELERQIATGFGESTGEEYIWSYHTPADFNREDLIRGLTEGYLRLHMAWESDVATLKFMLVPQNYGEDGIAIIREFHRR